MSRATYSLIRDAILQRRQVFATYGGLPRAFCPHVLGKKNGRAQALVYQFDGESHQGDLHGDGPDNWRCLHLDDLRDVRLEDGPWHSADNYGRHPQACVDVVDVEV
ncbi:hypothetical protein [Pseudomonas mangiferae]|uniref:Uncharacterized protein n=1 Tax=Pseudomonas mangiferae TaxID=2593654 RepID=A0A553H2Y4_9PSED|nr:hypothetical protein [Pseudomonas mangiferae]TRX76107.1 hypothetical protein FM069_02650 [Pseudomonas mangiferae]